MKSPIGIFDSGYGGLTIFKEIVDVLPDYDYIYLGDNARAPYGTKDYETIYQYTLQAVKWFFNQGCSLVILACNTASAKALRTIQQNDLPLIDPNKRVLGVIRPTSEIIGNYSHSNHVGILGTPGTVLSNSYLIEIGKFFPEMVVSQEACPEWVSLVENNNLQSAETEYYVQLHINQIMAKDKQIDTLLLACTHYPLLMNKIKQFTPEGIEVITQGKIVAASLKNYLERHEHLESLCSKTASQQFYTTGHKTDFNEHASLFFGAPVSCEQAILG